MAVRYIGTNTTGIDADANADLWVLREGYVLSNTADAFDFVGFTSVELVVDGSVYCETDAIDSDAESSNNKVTIGATGRVYGSSDGIEMSGNGHKVFNYGVVNGYGDRGIQLIGDSGTVLNAGTIFGHSDGISLEGDGQALTNTGLITSAFDGVNVQGTDITIYNSGQITGDRNGVEFNTNAGDTNRLENVGLVGTESGLGIGVRGDFGDETVINSGRIVGDVDLEAGNDVFDGRGGTVTGLVAGGTGADLYIIDDSSARLFEAPGGGVDQVQSEASFALPDFIENLTLLGAADIDGTGNTSQNTIIGNSGDNDLSGGGSRDTLQGGQGDDTIDGGRGDDVMYGDSGNDTLLGRAGVDIMDGGEDDDLLFGGVGNDIMQGGDGNDTLKGGLGADTMDGGAGQDTFVFCRVSDSPTSGTDRIDNFVVGEDRLDFTDLVSGTLQVNILGSYPGTGPALRTAESAGDTLVFVDADGDGSSDMRIELAGVIGLTESDFLV